MPATRRTCPDPLRRALLIRHNYKCLYCHLPIGSVLRRRVRAITTSLQWDHRIPFAWLQTNPANNWAPACNVCNQIKSSGLFIDGLDATRRWMRQAWAERDIEWIWVPEVSSEEDPHRWAVSFATYLASLPRRETDLDLDSIAAEAAGLSPPHQQGTMALSTPKRFVFDEEPDPDAELTEWLKAT